MTEDFLYYIWQHRLFNALVLRTIADESLEIISPGIRNYHAGADFTQAIIKINNITWAGHIEIHCQSSDWLKHRHHENEKYKSVILHVVYESDVIISRDEKENFPVLELKNYISSELLERYHKLRRSPSRLPCQYEIGSISPLQFDAWLSRLAISRIMRKEKKVFEIHRQCGGDWNEVLFTLLAHSFGFNVNEAAFELLAKSISYKQIKRHTSARLQLYALLFGQAGFLEEDALRCDDYYKILYDEYAFLKSKLQIVPIPLSIWNFLRLHPQNFPTIRLAQLSELLFCIPNLFDTLITHAHLFTTELLTRCVPDNYWKTHYHFGKESKIHSANIGKKTAELLQINMVIPVLFSYGSFMGETLYQERAIHSLEEIPFESNYITRFYQKQGFPSKNALHSQAILELHHRYCQRKKCLHCQIGNFILKK